jgi:hypothetical protein
MDDLPVPRRFEELARIGHDVRGPAGVVLGALDELERSLGESAASHAALLAMARRGARRLVRLADRYAITAELAQGVEPDLAPADLSALARGAIRDAASVHGRKEITLELGGALGAEPWRIDARVHGRWATAAIGDALLLLLRSARARVHVGCEAGPHGGSILSLSGDGDPSVLSRSWSSAQETGDGSLDEGELASRLVLGVMAVHGGSARLEITDREAGPEPRLVYAR